MKLAFPALAAFAPLAVTACVADSLPVGMLDPSTGYTESSATTTSDDTTSTGLPSTTSDADSTSDETGDEEDPCAQGPGPSGWQWAQRIGTEEGTETRMWLELLGDGVVVAGEHDRDPFVSLLQRYDSAGQLQWEHLGASSERAEAVRVLPNGDFLVCGHVSQPFSQLWLARFDAMGNELWSVDEPNMYCKAVDATESGNIVVGGMMYEETTPEGVPAVLRFDASGNLLSSWLDPDLPLTFGIQRMVTVGEEVVMHGEHWSDSGIWLGRLDANDQLVWGDPYFEEELSTRAGAIAVDPATGDIVLAGSMQPNSDDLGDLVLWRLSADGAMLWRREHDSGGMGQFGSDVVIAPSGNLVVGGYELVDTGDQPLVAAFDPAGELLWWTVTEAIEGLEGANFVFIDDVELDACGAIYVSGWGQWDDHLDSDSWLGRYVPPEGV